MIFEVNDELKEICKSIQAENISVEDWREAESSDEFQSDHYCGGYDADEDAFCFSYYGAGKREWWFQITCDDVNRILCAKLTDIEVRAAE